MRRQDVSTDPALHALAIRLARACRRIDQSCLMEAKWADADREFYTVILEGLMKQRSETANQVTSQSGD